MTTRVRSRQSPPLSVFQHADLGKSLMQIGTSFFPYICICAVLYRFPGLSWWVTPVLWLFASGFMVRIFIIQHDCGHGSFFASRRGNEVAGWLCSLITLAPYAHWRRQHALHHANWNNLDRRDSGMDIYSSCLTITEFNALSRLNQRCYRVLRNPIVSLLLLPPLVFLVLYRIPFDSPAGWRKEKVGVYLTDLGILGLILALASFFGFARVAEVQIPILVIAATVGVWLFSLQHRFEKTRWDRNDSWTKAMASVQGSSYLKLPRVLQWFTGNIGFHHVHHFSPRIPNYRLELCHRASPELQNAPVLSIWTGLKSWRYALWDESHGVMVPFPRRTAASSRSTA